MKNRRKLLLCIMAITLITIISVSAYTINDAWSDYKKTNGTLIAQDKSIIVEPDQIEKKEISDAWNNYKKTKGTLMAKDKSIIVEPSQIEKG